MKLEDFENEPAQPGVVVKGGPEVLRPYLGQVVAVVDGEIRAAGKTWSECLRAVKQAGLIDPELLFLPPASFIG